MAKRSATDAISARSASMLVGEPLQHELEAEEEPAPARVGRVLLRLDDVGARPGEHGGQRGDDARAVRTRHQQRPTS
jgi:hypothetical protein